jgi:hypothetical protein
MTQEEFEKAAHYHILTDSWKADEIQRKNLMYMFTICQGNWADFLRAAQLGHYY